MTNEIRLHIRARAAQRAAFEAAVRDNASATMADSERSENTSEVPRSDAANGTAHRLPDEESEARWELIESLKTTLDSIGDGVIAMKLSGAIARMNPVAEQLTGWTFADAEGRSLHEVLPLINGETRAEVESPFDHTLRERVVTALPKHTLLIRRDKSEIPIADSCAPIRSSAGAIHGAVLVFRDLTAMRDAENAQAKFQKKLVFAERMASVGTLAAGVAHELNNPLCYVAVNVDTAIEEIRAIGGGAASGRIKDVEQMLIEARDGIARIAKIVRGLKTLSRTEEETLSVTDLVPVLEMSINSSFNEIRHRARLVKTYGQMPLVAGDGARLGQVFINLLVNAAQSFPEGNTEANEIRVVTSTDPAGLAIVEVSDNGPGIDPALLNRVFDPFFTTKPIGIGTGLGLAISHSIVTGMGGQISIRSELGKGTIVRVALPSSASLHLVAPPAANRLPTEAPAARAAILVVDDEPGIGQAMRRVLSEHNVTAVTSAREALALLAGGAKFDVMLSDLMMPGMSGMELYEAIFRLYPALASRMVFMTGGAFTAEAAAFLNRVRNRRFEKPFTPGQLREQVRELLHGALAD